MNDLPAAFWKISLEERSENNDAFMSLNPQISCNFYILITIIKKDSSYSGKKIAIIASIVCKTIIFLRCPIHRTRVSQKTLHSVPNVSKKNGSCTF